MRLQLRSRPDYDPAVKLRRLPPPHLREVGNDFDEPEREEAAMEPEVPAASLPILATANDARELVRFLRKRPNGVTVVEAMNAEPRRIFDIRKIAAYEFWGIISRESERLTLTEQGRTLADALEPECRMHRDILHRVPAYKIAIQNIFDEGLDIATHLDVLRHWSSLKTIAAVNHDDAQEMEAAVVCFFSLCHAAELGTSTVGKRGQPARLRVDMQQVESFLAEAIDDTPTAAVAAKREPTRHVPQRTDGTITRVLVSIGGTGHDPEPLLSLLALAGFESVVVDFADADSGLLPSSELSEMQRCQTGIFVIGPGDCEKKNDGTFSLRREWITKISVAAALFDWRVLLFWNGPFPPPEELTASGLTIQSNEKLDWHASLEVVNRVKELAI